MAVKKILWDVVIEKEKKTRLLQVIGRDMQEAASKVRKGHRKTSCRKGKQVTEYTAGLLSITAA